MADSAPHWMLNRTLESGRASAFRRPSRGTATAFAAAALAVLATLAAPPAPASAQTAARDLFGAAREPAPLKARAIGTYARGCLAGAVPLAVDGPAWQVMRLSRNRNWGHPALIALVEKLAVDARADGWNGLLVGDLAQPRGGPMTSGHTSHQIGLDADIWLNPMPNRTLSAGERESISAVSMLKSGTRQVDPGIWTPAHAALIRRAARMPQTERIFVHPGIKKALCDSAGGDRAWLRKVRPWWGHDYHFHVRIRCPADSVGCSDQDAPPAGDGCGKELDWWLGDEPWKPATGPVKAKKPLTMAELPADCRAVVSAAAAGSAARVPAATSQPGAEPFPRPRP